MVTVADRLAAEGITLPVPVAPLGAYVPAVRIGSLVFTSGQLPVVDGAMLSSGVAGAEVSLEQARVCARQCAINILGALVTVCDLDSVVRVAKMVCYVASATGFTAQPAVADGASEVFVAAFGDAGRHAREAVGVAALPLGAPVEVSLVVEVV